MQLYNKMLRYKEYQKSENNCRPEEKELIQEIEEE